MCSSYFDLDKFVDSSFVQLMLSLFFQSDRSVKDVVVGQSLLVPRYRFEVSFSFPLGSYRIVGSTISPYFHYPSIRVFTFQSLLYWKYFGRTSLFFNELLLSMGRFSIYFSLLGPQIFGTIFLMVSTQVYFYVGPDLFTLLL